MAEGVGDVYIEADSGAFAIVEGGWTYVLGAITDLSPTGGQGGTRVAITGTLLLGGGDELKTATLNGVAAEIKSYSDTDVALVAQNAESSGTGDVVLVSNSGAIVTKADGWEYVDAGEITDVSPAIGQIGTEVTITGERLLGGGGKVISVHFGDVATTVVTSTNENVVLKCTSNLVAEDTVVDITVVSDTGAVVLVKNAWTFKVPGAITGVEPVFGTFGTRLQID